MDVARISRGATLRSDCSTPRRQVPALLRNPLSIVINPTLTGVLTDGSKSRFGRRRPYILGGSVVCLLSMLLLGYTRSFASIFMRLGTTAVCPTSPYLSDHITFVNVMLTMICTLRMTR